MHPFFTLYTKLLLNPHYHDTLIFNLDETPLCIHQSPKRTVITLPNQQLPRLTLPPRMANATLTLCICLDGTYLPPHLLWPTQQLSKQLRILRGRPMILNANGSGWQTQKSYEHMMLHYILPAAIKKRKASGLTDRKILFVLDSHISRMSVSVLQFCKKNKITILTIPAHSSYLTQPLDCGPNGAFKRSLSTHIVDECSKPEVLYLNAHQRKFVPLPLAPFPRLCHQLLLWWTLQLQRTRALLQSPDQMKSEKL